MVSFLRESRRILFAGILACLVTLSVGSRALAVSNPNLISFQGKVVNSDGTNVTNGSYTFRFRLYTSMAPTDATVSCGAGTATCKWEESKSVTVTNGVFQTELGDTSTMIDVSQYTNLYLGILFNGDAAGEMSPRIHFDSAPYALNSDKLGGIGASGFVQLGGSQSGNINIGTGTITSGAVNGQTLGTASTFTGTVAIQGSSALTLGTATTAPGAIIFKTGGANTVTLQGPTSNPGASYALKLPTTAPALSQCLMNDGTTVGQLTFATCSAGGGDNISVNGTAATDANFLNTTGSGTVTGTTWTLATGSTPNTISLALNNASAALAGAVTTGAQTFAGDKTFTGNTTQNAQTDLRFADADSSNYVAFQAPATVATNVIWTLPDADAAGCLQSDGSGTLSFGACGDTDIQTFSANGNYTVPANALMVIIEAWGGGGGGAGGGSGTTSAAHTGGAGGGGGAYNTTNLSATTLGTAGTTVPVTVGNGGSLGAGGTGAAGSNGGAGSTTCFSTVTACAGNMYLEAFGGGGGAGTGTAGNGGGGGGGTQSVGSTGSTTTGGGGGSPLGSAAGLLNSGSGGAGGATATTTAAAGGSSNWGGGGGGASTTAGANASGAGGGSNQGGAGGGAGGSDGTTCTVRAGGAGGHVPGLSAGGGTAGSTSGQAGGAGAAGAGSGGDGGGVGASNCTSAGTGGTGGTGGDRGGGGGGGGGASAASGTQHGGAGGNGGNGYLRAWTLLGAGADLAEMYCTNDTSLISGDTVSIDPSLRAGVQKSTKAYDPTALGIISTDPGLTMGKLEDACAKPVLVALAGRVPVAVSLENGPIKAGDELTASSTPGVAMKATKAGTVIGQALTNYDGSMPDGFVVAFVQNHQGSGEALTDLVPGLQTDSDVPVSQQALEYLMANRDKAIASQSISEITTDRVTAGIEIISPSVVTDALTTNSIGSSGGGDISFLLNDQNKLVVKGKTGAPGFSVDASGNATFGVSLISLGSIESQGGLTVNGDALFGGKATFTKLAEFQDGLSVLGHTTLGNDSGGLATIPQSGTRVTVTFSQPYDHAPIVSTTLVADQTLLPDGTVEDQALKEQRLLSGGYTYLLSNSSPKGFTIVLNKKASEDLTFNWNALAIHDPSTTVGSVDSDTPNPTTNNPTPQTTTAANQTITGGQF